MANHGFKIMKPGSNTSSTNINDHVFWSKYPPLIYMKKYSMELVINSTNGIPSGGVSSYAHGYGFPPLVFAVISDDTVGSKYFLPARDFSITGLSCSDANHGLRANFEYRVDDTNVYIDYTVYCAGLTQGVEDEAVLNSGTLNIELYFYMWELGSVWPV